MTDDIEVGARVAAALADAAPSPELGTRILRRVETRRARQRARRAGAAVAGAMAVIAAALAITASPGEREGSVATEPSPATFSWQDLPPAQVPARTDSTAVWTGEEVVLWGGRGPTASSSSRDGLRADGAAFNPATGSWRALPEAPIGPRGAHVAVWTGTEMLVWGGWRPEGPDEDASWSDGAAYNPTTDSWRRLPEAPVGARLEVGATWTGTELVIVGGVPAGPTGHGVLGAAYDPARDAWRPLPDLPVSGMTDGWATWTGREVLYLRPMGGMVMDGRVPSGPQFFAYQPDGGGGWRQAAAPPASMGLRWDGAGLAWAGSELLVVSESTSTGSEQRRRAVAYDPSTDTWRPVATDKGGRGFVPGSQALWNGHEVVTVGPFGANVSALHLASGTWATVPDGGDGLFGASAVATDGGDIYVFGQRRNARLVRLLGRAAP